MDSQLKPHKDSKEPNLKIHSEQKTTNIGRKKRKGTKESMERLDIDLTDPIPTYEELLNEIFQTGSRQKLQVAKELESSKSMNGTNDCLEVENILPKELNQSEMYQTSFREIATSERPTSSIQPYEYPLNLPISYPPYNRTVTSIFVTPKPGAKRKTDKRRKIKSKTFLKQKKSKTRTNIKKTNNYAKVLKKHKPVRPPPTSFKELER